MRVCGVSFSPFPIISSTICSPSRQAHNLLFPFWSYSFLYIPKYKSCISITHAKKRNAPSKTVQNPTIVEDENVKGEEGEALVDEYDDEKMDDEYIEDEYEPNEAELYVGDGGGGGGIKLAGTEWDNKVLEIAEEVSQSFDGDLKLYAFKTLPNSAIQVRIEKLSTKSGSPSMADVEAFSSTYRARLDEAELAGSVPKDVSLEVSSPGLERVVRVPEDLERFKDRVMYVKYVSEEDATTESDGVFSLVSFDLETNCCTWGLANVKINREKAGKGRPLNKKQREWRLNTSFDSLRLVRLYCEF